MFKYYVIFIMILIPQFAVADVCGKDEWVKENCPACLRMDDGKFLLPLDGKYFRFDVHAYGEEDELNTLRVDLIWHGLMEPNMRTIAKDVVFKTAGDRENKMGQFRSLCSHFRNYEYFSSRIEFTMGDYQTIADPSAGRVQQTCSTKPQEGWLSFLSPKSSSRCKDTRIDQTERAHIPLQKTIPAGSKTLPKALGR